VTGAAGRSEIAPAVTSLQGLGVEGLRQAWRMRLGGAPPRVRSADLLRRLLAERLQVAAFGADPELDRRLRALALGYARRKAAPKLRPVLKPGAVLTREFAGETHRVEVLADGFAYDGRTWRSLSQIARAIAGSRWNGPKFFGLRQG